MKTKVLTLVLGLTVLLGSSHSVHADTYSVFQTSRYYSANRQYFIQVAPNRRAMLFLNTRRPRILWSRILPDLPGTLLVTNNGRRAVIVDRYYGNGSEANLPVVIMLDERGERLFSHALGALANLSLVLRTISSAHWYKDARLDTGERFLVIDTVVAKRNPATCVSVRSPEEAEECFSSVPYERLRFDVATGKLASRESIVQKEKKQVVRRRIGMAGDDTIEELSK